MVIDHRVDYTPESFSSIVSLLQEKYSGWEGVDQFQDTPKRLAEMFNEFCWSPSKIESELDYHTKVFEDEYDETLSACDIVVNTLCPHHLLPCSFKVTIEYIPSGKVLGLSKFSRIAVILGHRPIMQETYTRELADCIYTRVEPKGVKVSVRGTHGCVKYRGALQETEIVTVTKRGEII